VWYNEIGRLRYSIYYREGELLANKKQAKAKAKTKARKKAKGK